VPRKNKDVPELFDKESGLFIADDTPEPTPELTDNPSDSHRAIPLDRDEDYVWLDDDDPRRQRALERLSRSGDGEEEIGYEGER
jgi:hypothetical protein